jgi:hypothetical protein
MLQPKWVIAFFRLVFKYKSISKEQHGLCGNTLYVGTLRPWQLLIPPGVAHGYNSDWS